MEKKVFCLINPRRKCIKYFANDGTSELQSIRQSLIAACKSDVVLNIMLKDKLIVFQKPDPNKETEWCDIEEDDVIDNNSEINVLLIEVPPNNASVLNITNFDPSNLNTNESVDMDLDVLRVELVDNDEKLIIPKQHAASSPMIQEKNEHAETNDEPKLCPQKKDDANMALAAGSSEQRGDAKPIIKRKHLELKGSIPSPAILPALSYDLEQQLKEIGIEKSQKQFIRFWGQYLWQETLGLPTKQDYYNLAATIVATYPLLAGGANENGIVRNQLSTWVRNHRANKKLKLKEKNRVNVPNNVKDSPSTKALVIANEEMDPMEIDVKMALAELEKKIIPGKNISHVKRLLSVTKSARRPWIENESGRIINIVEKYPALNHYDMILFECVTVVQNITEKLFFEMINKLMDQLEQFYFAEENNENIESCDTTNKQTMILEKLCEELTPKQLKRKISPLWTIQQVLSSTQPLFTNEGDAPRCVLYTSDTKIEKAFIVADEKIQVDIPEPTVPRSIGGLLASYYAWHRVYPPGYSSALEFISHKVLQTPLKSNSTVAKFKRKFNNFLKL